MKTILVPIDFSPMTGRVLVTAGELARGIHGRLVLLNVTHPRSMLADHERLEKTMAQLERHTSRAVPARRRNAAGVEGTPDAVRGDSLQLVGDPVSVILEQVKRISPDYIVMGSHGHSALHDLVFGSTAAGILKAVTCPVVIVLPYRRELRAPRRRSVAPHLRRTRAGRLARAQYI